MVHNLASERLAGPDTTASHGHGDHVFGAGPALAAFADSRRVAMTVKVVDEARVQTQPAALDNWTGWFGDQFDRDPAIPTALRRYDVAIGDHSERRRDKDA